MMQDEVDYYALGDRIKQARKRSNMTQEQLSECCALSTSYIGHIERGSRTLSVDTLFRIARTLNVSLDYLLLDSFEPEDTPEASIAAIFKDKDPNKVRRFWTVVQILAENIDRI